MTLKTIKLAILAILFPGFVLLAQQGADSIDQSDDHKLPPKEILIEDSTANAGTNLAEYEKAYFIASRWNAGIGYPPEDINLQTPQATLEHFIINSRNKDYEQAAYALNLNLLPDDISQEDAAMLAEKLNFVLEQRISIGWDGLSDRPDGQIDVSTSTNQAVAGQPRRSISFGQTDLNNRVVDFRLQRLKYKDNSPVWLISAQTVENIEPLYKAFGPRKLDRLIPGWMSFEVFGIPIWKTIGTIILMIMAYFIAKIVSHYLRKLFSNTEKYWIRNIAYRLASPAGAVVGILFFYLLLNNLISFTGPLARGIYALLLIIIISIITWLVMRVIDYIMDFFAEHKVGDLNQEENAQAKKLMTYISVGRRIFIFAIVIIGAAIIFSQFPSLEQLGISLMASAGIATVLFGIAAQSTLGNIIAGVQIAITKPAKIGDAVIIDDSYGFVEDITFTYMIVKTWDLRRKVIPLKTVISDSFENLSMTNAQSIEAVQVYADHRIDVDLVRKKFSELLKASDLWDEDEEKTPMVQVTEVDNKSIKIRCLCSAKDYPTTWDLHCELREKIVAYISELEDGFYWSKERVELEDKRNQSASEKND
ncbi:mechanosensitive ion channel family protein [Gramella sp. GC03-9]|uniref:Mechanosensitive ion channel family protein n=1 Tax=Christiangramia oceanisediminis TaxID=2920386 RepID=A0A9X2KWW5_9FLAO|nr:mechanosensitive ion channel domain-containing protein [Gramella oceanisediminis]MCP9200083.1 mechanosensitive ion channel family protein [Gramella oceanisediminis]